MINSAAGIGGAGMSAMAGGGMQAMAGGGMQAMQGAEQAISQMSSFSNFRTQFPGLKYRSAITCPRCSITFGEISGSLERYRGDVSFAPVFIMPPRCLAHGGGTFHESTRQEVSDKWNGLSCPVR